MKYDLCPGEIVAFVPEGERPRKKTFPVYCIMEKCLFNLGLKETLPVFSALHGIMDRA